MKKLIFTTFVLLLNCSCAPKTIQERHPVRLIYSKVIYSKCAMSIQKSKIITFEDLGIDDSKSGRKKFAYEEFQSNKEDSFILKQTFDIHNANDYVDRIKSISKAGVFIRDVQGFKFSNDSIPNSLKSKEVIGFRTYRSNWYYILRDALGNLSFNVGTKDSKDILLSYPLQNHTPFYPEFFLEDVVGDSNPEVFIFTRGNYPSHDFCYIDLYKINL